MKKNKDWIYRFSIPGKYDHAPKGTICNIPIAKKDFSIYCQVSDEEDCPQWAFIGEFTEGMPRDYIHSEIDRVLSVEHNIKQVNKVENRRLNFKGAYKNEHKQGNNNG